jgi:translation initiation factor 2 alpha subunit (eIF-2alpha)
VRILQIDPDRQRLSLSQRRVRQHEEIDWIRQRHMDASEEEEE